LLAFAADTGSFAALGSQHVGIAGVGAAPAQVVLELAGQHGVAGVARAAQKTEAIRTAKRYGIALRRSFAAGSYIGYSAGVVV